MARIDEADPRWIVAGRDDGKNVGAWHWEEKDMLQWTKKRLGEIYTAVEAHVGDGEKVVLSKLASATGDVALHQRKGRKFFTCEIDLKINWTAELKEGDAVRTASGTISLPEVSNSDKNWASQVVVDEADRALRSRFEFLVKVYGVSAAKKGIEQLFADLKEMSTFLRPIGLRTPADNDNVATFSEASVAEAAASAAPAPEMKRPAAAPSAPAVRVDAIARQAPGVQTRTVQLEDVFMCSPVRCPCLRWLLLCVYQRAAAQADLYAALLDPPRIAAYTQAPAKVERAVGGTFELLGGSITGVFVELVRAFLCVCMCYVSVSLMLRGGNRRRRQRLWSGGACVTGQRGTSRW
jgi:activator of HSP90 ATPase